MFNFSFPIHLQASRSTRYPAGRRYYISVAAKDNDGWNGKTIPVQVPISLTDRGPGPVKGRPPSKAYLAKVKQLKTEPTKAPTPTKPGIGSIFSGL